MRVVKASQRQRFVGASTGIELAARNCQDDHKRMRIAEATAAITCVRSSRLQAQKWWVLACPVSVPNWRADTDAAENYEWPLAI